MTVRRASRSPLTNGDGPFATKQRLIYAVIKGRSSTLVFVLCMYMPRAAACISRVIQRVLSLGSHPCPLYFPPSLPLILTFSSSLSRSEIRSFVAPRPCPTRCLSTFAPSGSAPGLASHFYETTHTTRRVRAGTPAPPALLDYPPGVLRAYL